MGEAHVHEFGDIETTMVVTTNVVSKLVLRARMGTESGTEP